MLANDKSATTNVNIEDNINTRDQKRAAIWLIVLVVLFTGFLVALGLGHAPSQTAERQNEVSPVSGNPPGGQNPQEFSVNVPVGPVELPGTVGEPQKFMSGHGNTPVPQQGVSPGVSPNTAENVESFSKAQSGKAASDTMQTGKNYKNGMQAGATGGGAATGTSH